MREARRSVSDSDLLKYSSFANKMKQSRGAMGTNVENFEFPDQANHQQNKYVAPREYECISDDNDDLYGDNEEMTAQGAANNNNGQVEADDDEGLYD